MSALTDQVNAIRSREDFVAFVRQLGRDYVDNPEQWENRDLETYLDALAAWVEDMDGFFQNRGEPTPENPDWRVLGFILMAACIYE